MKHAILVTLTMMASLSTAHADKTADKQEVNTACASDAQTAGCAGEVVGKGLLKCLHHYKKAHPEFTFSAACKAAKEQFKADVKNGK